MSKLLATNRPQGLGALLTYAATERALTPTRGALRLYHGTAGNFAGIPEPRSDSRWGVTGVFATNYLPTAISYASIRDRQKPGRVFATNVNPRRILKVRERVTNDGEFHLPMAARLTRDRIALEQDLMGGPEPFYKRYLGVKPPIYDPWTRDQYQVILFNPSFSELLIPDPTKDHRLAA